jgi:A/G-specific adenine glycosylase
MDGGVLNGTAFVDTNARRVLHRLFFGADVPEPSATERELLRLAETLVPRGRGWKWGQSVIEFGAIQCTARKTALRVLPLERPLRREAHDPGRSNQPAARAEKATYRYEGSNRYYRGRVLAVLRETPEESVTLHELGGGLREGFGEEDMPWLRDIVESLEKDGLVKISSTDDWSQAVTEERAAYGNERPEGPPCTTTRVSLP